MQKFSIKEAFKAGWNAFKKYPALIIGISIVTVSVLLVFNSLSNSMTDGGRTFTFPGLIVWLANIAIQIIISLGLVKISLKLLHHEKPHFSDLFTEYKKGLQYLGASILFFLVVGGIPAVFLILGALNNSQIMIILGRLLFFLSSIFIGLRLMFYSYLIVDKNFGAIDSLKKSYKITQGQIPGLFLFTLASLAVVILGALAILAGLFVAIPVVMVASAYVYKKIIG